MLQLKSKKNGNNGRKRNNHNGRRPSYSRLVSIGRASKEVINKLYSPIDSTNRFINLALHGIDENSQSRQFLLESKAGIRKTSLLLKRLDRYAKKIEKEIREILSRRNS